MPDPTPVQIGDAREKLLAKGLRELAAKHKIKLDEPLQIDTNGEFRVVAVHPNDGFGCGQYGTFAAVLNRYYVRMGINPTQGHVMPSAGWCRMNHFEVEKMLQEETGVDYSHAAVEHLLRLMPTKDRAQDS